MNLPILRPIYEKDEYGLNPKRSVFYTFSKALKDLDYCNNSGEPFYMSSFVALKLPKWEEENFYFKFRRATSTPSGDILYHSDTFGLEEETELSDNVSVDKNYVNPNYIIPRIFGYYLENMLRQNNTGGSGIDCKRIAEVSFWKTLKYFGIEDISSCIQYVNKISTVSYTEIANNHGWVQIMCEIPNYCKHFDNENVNIWTDSGVDLSVGVSSEFTDAQIYDSNQSFDYSVFNQCLNFNNIYNPSLNILNDEVADIEFNVILLFYKDHECEDGTEKLYGVNFILPFEKTDEILTLPSYEMPTFKHKTNNTQTFGYNFRFNIKSCTNDTTKESIPVITPAESSFFDLYSEVLTKLNSFLEIKLND